MSMFKVVLPVTLFLCCFCACSEKKKENETKEISVGKYIFTFPSDYNLSNEQGVDSHVGSISNGKITFEFDYGYYSNKLEKTPLEYFSDNTWKLYAFDVWNDRVVSAEKLPGAPDEFTSIFMQKSKLISLESKDGQAYKLQFLYFQDTISFSAVLPSDIRLSKIEVDTSSGVIYKYVSAEKYVGLYAKDTTSYNKSINSYMALSITMTGKNPQKRAVAEKILRTCRKKAEL